MKLSEQEMNRIRGPRLADPTKEQHRYLRALPEGNHFIEVTFRNIRTGESFPPRPHGKVYMLTSDLYKWLSERQPFKAAIKDESATPEKALACLLDIAARDGVKPRSRPQHNPEYEPVFAKYLRAYLFGERGDELAKTKARLVHAYLKKRYGHPSADKVWTSARQNLSRTLGRRLKADILEQDFPRK